MSQESDSLGGKPPQLPKERVRSPWDTNIHSESPKSHLASGSGSADGAAGDLLGPPPGAESQQEPLTPLERGKLAALGLLTLFSSIHAPSISAEGPRDSIGRVLPPQPSTADRAAGAFYAPAAHEFNDPMFDAVVMRQQAQFISGTQLQTDWNSAEVTAQLDRIVASMADAQPERPAAAEKEQAKSDLKGIYQAVEKDLQDPEKIADKIIDLGSDALKSAVEHSPQLAGPVLIALGLKRSKPKGNNAMIQRTGEDLQQINELYARGAPLTPVNLHLHLHFDEPRARAALQAGGYIDEWHPGGLRIVLETKWPETSQEKVAS